MTVRRITTPPLLVLLLLAFVSAAGAGVSDALRAPTEPLPLEAVRTPVVEGLSAFQLRLGATPEEIEARLGGERLGFVAAGPDRYLHLALQDGAQRPSACPAGLDVLDGDLYFLGGRSLIEASLFVSAPAGSRGAIDTMIAELGEPDFEVLLPGSLGLSIGWRSKQSYVLAFFTDLPVFRLNAFQPNPDDLLAGSSLVLFEALDHFADRVAAGVPAREAERDLRDVVAWVDMAREKLQPH
jgi:hypothetical protein